MSRVAVDLQEHVADPQCRPLAVSDNDFDLSHTGHYPGHSGEIAQLVTPPRVAKMYKLAMKTIPATRARQQWAQTLDEAKKAP